MADLFVIIVTYNGMKWLNKCLASLELSDIAHRVVIIDNASTDDSVPFIEANYPQHILIKSDANLGFAKANNLGIDLSLKEGAKHVFLLNQDCYVEPNTLSHLIGISQRNPEFGIVSPIHLDGSGNYLDEKFRKYLKATTSVGDDLILGKIKDIYPTTFVNAAAWLITRECLLHVGGFDTQIFFHYGEDDNYCQRVLFHDFKIGIATGTTVRHDRIITKRPFNYNRELTNMKIPTFDINLSPIEIVERFAKEEAKIAIKAMKSAGSFRLKDSFLYLKLMGEFTLICLNSLKKNRKINMNSRSAWLDKHKFPK